MRHQPLRRRKAQFAVADLIRHRAEVGFLRVHQHDEIVPVSLLVPQEQILAVCRLDRRPVPRGLLDGRDRRMLEPLERNRELAQSSNDRGFLRGHGVDYPSVNVS